MQSQLYVAFWQVMLQIPFELLHLSYLDNTFSATPNVPPGMANIYIYVGNQILLHLEIFQGPNSSKSRQSSLELPETTHPVFQLAEAPSLQYSFVVKLVARPKGVVIARDKELRGPSVT